MTVKEAIDIIGIIDRDIRELKEYANQLSARHDMDEHFLCSMNDIIDSSCLLLDGYKDTILKTELRSDRL